MGREKIWPDRQTYLRWWRLVNKGRYNESARIKQKEDRKKNPEKYRKWNKDKYKRIKADPIRYENLLFNSKFIQRTKGKTTKVNYRARKKGAEGSHTNAEWIEKMAILGNKCYYCSAPLSYFTATRDHLIPLSKGGSNYIHNIVPACNSCNCGKGNRPTYKP